MIQGITIKTKIGVGDALQFCSLPENYFRTHSRKIICRQEVFPWFFDHNPFVDRESKPDKVTEMWNFPQQYPWPNPREADKPKVYLSNAEIWASVFGCKVFLNRPRLYKFEDYPFEKREMILLHTDGVSHGEMPKHIVDHVIAKYARTKNLFHIGNSKIDYGIPKINTVTLWDLAEVISKAKMIIGVDSAPAWIASCYPDIVVKKLRTKPNPPELFESWIPLEQRNIHSMWDSREHNIFNVSDRDYGFTMSYKKI